MHNIFHLKVHLLLHYITSEDLYVWMMLLPARVWPWSWHGFLLDTLSCIMTLTFPCKIAWFHWSAFFSKEVSMVRILALIPKTAFLPSSLKRVPVALGDQMWTRFRDKKWWTQSMKEEIMALLLSPMCMKFSALSLTLRILISTARKSTADRSEELCLWGAIFRYSVDTRGCISTSGRERCGVAS